MSANYRKFASSMAAACVLVVLIMHGCDSFDEPRNESQVVTPGSNSGGVRDVSFCFWNVENLFDDKDDGRTQPGDKEYDGWLAHNPLILRDKLAKVADGILATNGGKGPDILGMCEVESIRAAQLLQQTLNDRLDPALHYTNLLMKEVSTGRHIAPVLLTRLPVRGDHTQLLNSRLRILKTVVVVDGKELNVIVSHWSSRLQQTAVKSRADYADKIYGVCNAMYNSDPSVDFLICGDFNDTPTDPSVTDHLHATADSSAVMSGPPLRLYNLMAAKDPAAGHGTHYYRGNWFIFDQIIVSPGMLDNVAWNCDPSSVKTFNRLARPDDRAQKPWRYGGEKETGPRGYSDHFPVTVRLRVQ